MGIDDLTTEHMANWFECHAFAAAAARDGE